MDRPRRESRQHNGITVRGLSQPTFATKSARTGPLMPFYEESDATRAARLFRLADGRRLRCLLKAHSGVGADAPEHDLVPVMAWRGFVPAHGSRDARYVTIARRS